MMTMHDCLTPPAGGVERVSCGEPADICDRFTLAGPAFSVDGGGLASGIGRPDGSPLTLRILFLVSAHNGLSQRAWIALTELGHEVTVAVIDSAAAMDAVVQQHDPELIVCPFLKRMIPESIWTKHRCLIVHPGPMGDRGPSSLDWAIELGMLDWGVTVLEANGELDAGEVWATRSFRMRQLGKSSLYRHEVRHAAIEALMDAIGKILDGGVTPEPLDADGAAVPGRARPLMTQNVRAIDWGSDCTDTVLRKIRAGEGHPGVLDSIHAQSFICSGRTASECCTAGRAS